VWHAALVYESRPVPKAQSLERPYHAYLPPPLIFPSPKPGTLRSQILHLSFIRSNLSAPSLANLTPHLHPIPLIPKSTVHTHHKPPTSPPPPKRPSSHQNTAAHRPEHLLPAPILPASAAEQMRGRYPGHELVHEGRPFCNVLPEPEAL
jgi:hypothetical protein